MTETELTAERVTELFSACLAAPGTAGAVKAEGIVNSAEFSPGALETRFPEIIALLAELPSEFRKSGGGGWSFLNACNDRHGAQWTALHRTMEELFMLGMAIGRVTLMLPRDMWTVLPGGMPYYVVDADAAAARPEESQP